MNFEFLICFRHTQGTHIEEVLHELLAKVLEDNLNEFEADVVSEMIQLRQERRGEEFTDNNGNIFRFILLCFVLELPDETAQLATVVEEFAVALAETPPITHAVKFEDPILHGELVRRAREIFSLEMKLRRVLTLIYLHAQQENDPYDLLGDEAIQPPKEKLHKEQMQVAVENQFFHLTFSQYVGLNRRPEFKLSTLLEVMRDSGTYEAFCTELNRQPIEQEDDAVLLAGLRERMDAIETMRNCVAHNRRPSSRVTENYKNARPLLDQMLNEYLARWDRNDDPPLG